MSPTPGHRRGERGHRAVRRRRRRTEPVMSQTLSHQNRPPWQPVFAFTAGDAPPGRRRLTRECDRPGGRCLNGTRRDQGRRPPAPGGEPCAPPGGRAVRPRSAEPIAGANKGPAFGPTCVDRLVCNGGWRGRGLKGRQARPEPRPGRKVMGTGAQAEPGFQGRRSYRGKEPP